MNFYCADFETRNIIPNSVWLWGVVTLDDPEHNFNYGTDMKSFIDYCAGFTSETMVYFHNLKFDCSFIIDWLLKNGFKHVDDITGKHQFTTIITDTMLFYKLTLVLRKSKNRRSFVKIHFVDSWKIFPISVEKIAKSFALPYLKQELDYKLIRPIDYVPTADEINYLKHDLFIPAYALSSMHQLYKENQRKQLKKMTIGSIAFAEYKRILGSNIFNDYFPNLDHKVISYLKNEKVKTIDDFIRQAYKGGFTYLNEGCENNIYDNIKIYDINSLYPTMLHDAPMPKGSPIPFQGEYVFNKHYPLYIIKIECSFKIKPGKLPTIQIKGLSSWCPTQYLKSSDNEIVELYMTNIDLDLFLENYDHNDINYVGGYMFMKCNNAFTRYIDEYYGLKCNTKNKSLYQIYKLLLNNLYGKMGLNPISNTRVPSLGSDGVVKYADIVHSTRSSIYCAVACFTTAHARSSIIRSAQFCDNFIYCDTDSLHLAGDPPENMEIDNVKLGAFKLENTPSWAKYLKPKTYAYEVNGKLIVKSAGMTDDCKRIVDKDNFYLGKTFPVGAQRKTKVVEGGILIYDTTFTIK